MIITRGGDWMYARVPGGQIPTTEALEFVPIAPDRFMTVDGRLNARLASGPDGSITAVEVAGMVLPRQP